MFAKPKFSVRCKPVTTIRNPSDPHFDMSPTILIDTSVLVAFYNANDRYHTQSYQFFDRCTSNLVTTTGCVTETMWLLAPDYRIQNLFLSHLSQQIYQCEPLIPQDFARILELNQQYADLPGDFADLSLVAVSERLNIAAIARSTKISTSIVDTAVSPSIGYSHRIRNTLQPHRRPPSGTPGTQSGTDQEREARRSHHWPLGTRQST